MMSSSKINEFYFGFIFYLSFYFKRTFLQHWLFIYLFVSKRGMRPQSGHRAQHAYYVMRKQRHGVDLAIYGPKVWHRGARGAASGGPRCGIGVFWGSKRASLAVEKLFLEVEKCVSGGQKVHRRCLRVCHVEKARKLRHSRKKGAGGRRPEPGGNLE